LAAEHGYFLRWSRDSEWECTHLSADLDWKNIAEPVMQLYTEATDGSSIEIKESALVWHHQDADPDFGSCQAKELLDHLESVLANEPAVGKYFLDDTLDVVKLLQNVISKIHSKSRGFNVVFVFMVVALLALAMAMVIVAL
ncbi:hypothetical protein HN873_024175, partial [Arachis hypogaea]